MKYIDILNTKGESREVYKVFIVGAKEDIEIETEMVLSAPETYGNTEVKAIVLNGGKLTLKGMIRIKGEGTNANAFLRQNVLLVGDNSKAIVTPDLEIETNDVKASHAATVGRINEEEMFYLMSRGLKEKAAQKMIMESFLEELLLKIDKKEAKAIRKKLAKLI
ncbi:MAG TPA: SufD family Fe-S cluster assembly protein [Patescibacteria group bacterium]